MAGAAGVLSDQSIYGKIAPLSDGGDAMSGSGPLADTAKRTAAYDANVASLEKRLESRQGAARDRINARVDTAPPPPALQPMPPQPEPKQTDPAQVWGSLAMLAAALGGAMTHTPATTAFNAAANVMKAYHQKDQEAFDQEYKRWQTANDNLLRVQNYQVETYKAAMGKIRDIDRLDATLTGQERLNTLAEIGASARAFGNTTMAERAEAGDLRGVVKLQQDQEKLIESQKKATAQMDKLVIQHQELAELQKTDEYKNASKLDQWRMQMQIVRKNTPDLGEPGGGSQGDMRVAQSIYKTIYADPNGGIKTGAPAFDQWYKTQWPTVAKPEAAKPAVAPSGHQKGEVITAADGKKYRYKGEGDWEDKNSFEPVEGQ